MNSPTTKPEVYKALSQLTAVITGGKFARATKNKKWLTIYFKIW